MAIRATPGNQPLCDHAQQAAVQRLRAGSVRVQLRVQRRGLLLRRLGGRGGRFAALLCLGIPLQKSVSAQAVHEQVHGAA